MGGIPIEYINETHVAGTSASGSTSGAQILSDIDSYLITIPSSVWPLRVDGTATTGNIQAAEKLHEPKARDKSLGSLDFVKPKLFKYVWEFSIPSSLKSLIETILTDFTRASLIDIGP